MASTRQTLSMDCGSSLTPTWAASKPQEKLIQNQEDSLDLELGASASHVDKNLTSRPLVDRLSERSNGKQEKVNISHRGHFIAGSNLP